MSTIDFQVIDVDNHYYEPDDCFSRHIAPGFEDRTIRPVPSSEPGVSQWALAGTVLSGLPANAADRSPAPGAFEDLFAGKAAVEETAANLYRPKDVPHIMERSARLVTFDEQGIQAAIMLPTLGLGVEHDFKQDIPALCANYRSFNLWLEEEWGYGADGRIFSVPMVTLLDVDFAVAETLRVAALGAKFVYLNTGPVASRSPADPVFDRFWKTIEETGLRVVWHIGFTDFTELYSKHWSEDPKRTVYEYSALQVFHAVIERPITDTFAALILHNLFGRFPKVQMLTIELGSAWIRPLLRILDKTVKFSEKGNWLGGKLDALPSEILPQHVHVTPYFEEDIHDLAELIGIDRVLFGSDYPHPEGLKVPGSYRAKSLKGFSDDEVRLIMHDNSARLLGLPVLATV